MLRVRKFLTAAGAHAGGYVDLTKAAAREWSQEAERRAVRVLAGAGFLICAAVTGSVWAMLFSTNPQMDWRMPTVLVLAWLALGILCLVLARRHPPAGTHVHRLLREIESDRQWLGTLTREAPHGP